MSLETYVPSENMEIKNVSVDDKLRELDEKVGVSQEVLNRLDPEGYGYFRYEMGELENFQNYVLNRGGKGLEMSGDRHGSIVDKLENVLLRYNGRGITPELIDSMISDLCDCEYVATIYDGTKVKFKLESVIDYSKFGGPDSLVGYVLAYVDYLQPKTVNKIMEHSESVSIRSARGGNYGTFNQIKKFYDKLDGNHKKMYYSKLFKDNGRVDFRGKYLTEMYMLDDLGNYIFEKPLSSDTFTKLKDFIEYVNEDGNGIKESRTSSKKAIDQLKNNGQITESQAKDLYRAGGIKYEK